MLFKIYGGGEHFVLHSQAQKTQKKPRQNRAKPSMFSDTATGVTEGRWNPWIPFLHVSKKKSKDNISLVRCCENLFLVFILLLTVFTRKSALALITFLDLSVWLLFEGGAYLGMALI